MAGAGRKHGTAMTINMRAITARTNRGPGRSPGSIATCIRRPGIRHTAITRTGAATTEVITDTDMRTATPTMAAGDGLAWSSATRQK